MSDSMSGGVSFAKAFDVAAEIECEQVAEQAIAESITKGGEMVVVIVRERDATRLVRALTIGRNHEIEPTEIAHPSLDVFGWRDAGDDGEWFVRVLIGHPAAATV